jgi:hypothetical protein
LFGDGFVHSSLKLGFHLIQLRLQPSPHRLPQHREPSIAPLLHADMPVSRPAELHHRPLAEPSVRLSPHSAPIRQTCRSYGLPVARIEVLLLPVASVVRPPDPTPSLQPHYEPSPSRPGEFRPEPLTDPCLTVSGHTARATPGRPAPSVETIGFLLLPVDPCRSRLGKRMGRYSSR